MGDKSPNNDFNSMQWRVSRSALGKYRVLALHHISLKCFSTDWNEPFLWSCSPATTLCHYQALKEPERSFFGVYNLLATMIIHYLLIYRVSGVTDRKLA